MSDQELPPIQTLSPLAQKFATELEAAWKENPDDPWFFVKKLNARFIRFVDFSEKAMRMMFERVKVLEQALGDEQKSAPPVTQQQQQPQQVQQQTAPQMRGAGGRPPGPGWVRLDAMGQPMAPQDAEAEERADMSIDGKIDETRYVPIDSVRSNGAPPSQG